MNYFKQTDEKTIMLKNSVRKASFHFLRRIQFNIEKVLPRLKLQL